MAFWLILLFTIIFTIIYQCILKRWNYFSRQNVKFVRGPPFIGAHYRALLGKESTPDSFQKLYEIYPNERFIGMFDIGGKPSYIIRDPELIKQIAIRDFDHFTNHSFDVHEKSDSLYGRSLIIMKDQRWKDMRSTLSPAFTSSKMKQMFQLLDDVSRTFCEFMKSDLKDQSITCDVKEYFIRYATDAIASCAFGVKVNSLKDRNNEFFSTCNDLGNFDGLDSLIFFAYGTIPKIMNFFRIRVFREKPINYFRKVVVEAMEYREKNKIGRPDMIQLLMDAKKGVLDGTEVGDGDAGFAAVQEVKLGNKVKKWHDDDLVAQCLAFFLGGFNPVSLALCFAVHELALNQNVQNRLYEEITETNRQLNGQGLTYETLNKMKYLDMVISETLRRWTQSAANDRCVNKPYIMEDYAGNKVRLNVGDGIWIPVQGLHMDPKYFPNPTKFDPERFNDENKKYIKSGVYLPFGIGPRNCIASKFALMECKTMIYYLILMFHIDKCKKTQDPLELRRNSGSVDAECGFWVKLNLRN